MTTGELEELRQLRRKVRVLEKEQEIFSHRGQSALGQLSPTNSERSHQADYDLLQP